MLNFILLFSVANPYRQMTPRPNWHALTSSWNRFLSLWRLVALEIVFSDTSVSIQVMSAKTHRTLERNLSLLSSGQYERDLLYEWELIYPLTEFIAGCERRMAFTKKGESFIWIKKQKVPFFLNDATMTFGKQPCHKMTSWPAYGLMFIPFISFIYSFMDTICGLS